MVKFYRTDGASSCVWQLFIFFFFSLSFCWRFATGGSSASPSSTHDRESLPSLRTMIATSPCVSYKILKFRQRSTATATSLRWVFQGDIRGRAGGGWKLVSIKLQASGAINRHFHRNASTPARRVTAPWFCCQALIAIMWHDKLRCDTR